MGINLNLDPTATKTEIEEKRPPFQAGDHLTRFEFEKRYSAYPEIKKAELIEGVVYVPSPVRITQHGSPHFILIGWLNLYLMETPGLVGADNATVRLDLENEVQPDALIYLEPELGGQAYVGEDGYLEGAPEFIAEIAASTVAYDLHDKWRVYARSGVKEYLAFQVYEMQIDWFILREGRYETIKPDENGVLKSEIFPGLWLNSSAFWQRDVAALKATLDQGHQSAEYQAFVKQFKK